MEPKDPYEEVLEMINSMTDTDVKRGADNVQHVLDQLPSHLRPWVIRAFAMIWKRIFDGDYDFIRMVSMFWFNFSMAEDIGQIAKLNQVLMDTAEELYASSDEKPPKELLH